MADKRISQLIERTDILNNDVLPIVASGATTTNKVTISTIQNWMQDNLDVGVTSVGITLGSSGTDVNVTGSPITTSGNITINIPTASATNRGLLSSADWSTFNGKQNSITLTTSGTSGAATLVGSTLNIPNYSTGVANAYVPYVGAIGSVTLGYNSLSASQINIDGASPTGGSYLGFKHSTSVNTGTDGYTSMYTFGTNTIAFKSVSGGNSKDFSFSMVGITPNVAGGRQYTLPDASGTLALTSDLSGYVTLGTAQTITGSKTFNSRIIGQDATLTGSGSADTLEVTHTSGSGIAVDISKAGNGEGLRVAKTSGSGNAVTITGGLLSAEAGTFSGDLQSSTRLIAAAGGQQIILTPNLATTSNRIETTGSLPLEIVSGGNITFAAGGATPQITLANTGAVTLTGSLNGTTATFLSGSSSTIGLIVGGAGGSGATRQGQIRFGDAGTVYKIQGGEDYSAINFMIGSSTPLSLSSTGAATFTGDITASSNAYFGTFNGNDKYHFEPFTNAAGGANNAYFVSGKTDNNERSGFVFQARNSNGEEYNAVIVEGHNSTSTTTALSISSTGAATFSSSVTASSFNLGNGQFLRLTRTSGGLQYDALGIVAGTDNTRLISTGDFDIVNGALTSYFKVSSTGAATFSSSIDMGLNRLFTGGGFKMHYRNSTVNITYSGTSNWQVNNDADNAVLMSVLNGGNVGIGTASPSRKLQVEVGSDAGGGQNWSHSNGTVFARIGITNPGVNNNTEFGSASNNDLVLLSNNTERMRITSGGGLLVGKTDSNVDIGDGLRIDSDGSIYASIANAESTYWLRDITNTTYRFRVSGAGTVFATNTTISSISDERLKENIRDLDSGLDKIMLLKPRIFDWKEGSGQSGKDVRGFIAQEVEEHFPELIDEWSNENLEEDEVPYKSVRMDIIPLLVKSIQELKAEIESLKSQING